jgi:hypothetical protein
MARRSKQAAAEAIQLNPTEQAPPRAAEISPDAAEPPKVEEPPRQFLADPFPFKTVNAGGTRVHFQHSRQAGEFQIRFGDGSKDDMPSDAVRDFIKSHKVEVETKDGEKKEVQLFHWNEHDRAWGMRIRVDPAATEEERISAREDARQTAKKVFDDVVQFVAQERGGAQGPER